MKSFYSMPEYEEWRESHKDDQGYMNKQHIKYYKGLGTNTAEEGKAGHAADVAARLVFVDQRRRVVPRPSVWKADRPEQLFAFQPARIQQAVRGSEQAARQSGANRALPEDVRHHRRLCAMAHDDEPDQQHTDASVGDRLQAACILRT